MACLVVGPKNAGCCRSSPNCPSWTNKLTHLLVQIPARRSYQLRPSCWPGLRDHPTGLQLGVPPAELVPGQLSADLARRISLHGRSRGWAAHQTLRAGASETGSHQTSCCGGADEQHQQCALQVLTDGIAWPATPSVGDQLLDSSPCMLACAPLL